MRNTKEENVAEADATTHRNANTTTTATTIAVTTTMPMAAETTNTNTTKAKAITMEKSSEEGPTTPTRKNDTNVKKAVIEAEEKEQQKDDISTTVVSQPNGEINQKQKHQQQREKEEESKQTIIRSPRASSTPPPSPTPPPPAAQQVLIIPGQQASTLATNAAKKIRRAFSMPRNPFRWSRKFRTAGVATAASASSTTSSNGNVSRGGNTAALTSCVGGGRGRSGSIVSLNSYEVLVCKDTNGNVKTPATTTTTTTTMENMNIKGNTMAASTATTEKKSSGNQNNHTRVLRRSSFRKFLNRIAQHLSASVNTVGANKHNTTATTTAPPAVATTTSTVASSERVPPIGGYQWPADQTPGVMGLKNHGNTCFMNAVLQCLSHTDILAEYFVLDQYKADLKRRNKINARKFGTKGELTEQLANVLKALWTCKNESDHSTGFKAVVDRYSSQFRSSTQHDAQEFLFWLLDKVHEDLNTATKRRYKSVKNNYGRPDEVIAAETLANHIRCNNSFVQAVFQAQFRSSLTCPRCEKQSNTFDPFHCISVQLPQLTQQTIFVSVVYMKSQKPRQVRMGLAVPAGSPIATLREQLHTDTGIATDCMVLVDLNKDGFTRVFYDTQPVETLKGIETIYCIEVPETKQKPKSDSTELKKSSSKEQVITTTPTTTTNTNNNITVGESTKTIGSEANNNKPNGGGAKSLTSTAAHATDLLLLVANVHKKRKLSDPKPLSTSSSSSTSITKSDSDKKEEDKTNTDTIKNKEKEQSEEFIYERFSAPFSMKAPRDCSYMELQKKMLREMSSLLKPEVFSYTTPLTDMFKIRLQDPSADPDTFLEQVEHPLLTEMIDLALSVLSAEAGPPHIKLLLEWNEPEEYFVEIPNINEVEVEHESVARLNATKPNDTASLTLEQCLEHYTKAETLSAEDAWRCPHCQQYLPVVKTLGLWSLPDILVVHFKRFRQHQEKGPQAAKLTTMVKFPLTAFDMSPHLARDTNGEVSAPLSLDVAAAAGTNYRPSPWKKTRNGDSRSSTLNSRAEQKDTRYDLYAVCYHQGDTLETGHYTAACKNPYDRHWYKFDDQRVSKVPEDAIQDEIINNEAYMLFYQRRIVDATECSGSSSNSGDHWVSRIAPPPSLVANKEKVQEKQSNVEKIINNTQAEDETQEKEKLQSKPVEIPKVTSEIDEDESLNVNADDNGIEATHQTVVMKPTALEKRELLNIEEIDYADADISAENIDNNKIMIGGSGTATILVKDNDKSAERSHPDVNTIFVMDEDVTVHHDDVITPPKTNSKENIAAKPDIHSIAKEVLTPQLTDSLVISNGKLSPHDIKSHSASNTSSSASSSTSSLSSGSSPHSLAVSVTAASSLHSKLNGHAHSAASAAATTASINATNYNGSHKELQQLSSSLKSQSSSMNGGSSSTPLEYQLSHQHLHNNHQHHSLRQNWQGSRSSVSAVENATQQTQRQTTSLKLRHSFSTSSNYKLRECSETLSSLLRNSANTCSKDTLLFIDQQTHHHGSLIEDDSDSYMGRSLWISPVTPHKLITVSPKN